MKSPIISIQSIKQKDNYTFTIIWSDGKAVDYRLSAIQRNCSCAKCKDEYTGKQLVDPRSVDDNVRAKRIASVGRYALKIEFTSGCSLGIYDFDSLWHMADSRGGI